MINLVKQIIKQIEKSAYTRLGVEVPQDGKTAVWGTAWYPRINGNYLELIADGEVQGRLNLLTGIGEEGDDGEVFLIGKVHRLAEVIEILEDICLSEENILNAMNNLRGAMLGNALGNLVGKTINE